MRYVFENFVLDVEKHELRNAGDQVSVEPQVFALLIHLIEQRERVVSKEELIEAIWEGRFVSDSVVSSRIKSARKALGDDGRAQQFIKTLHGAGFRFIAPVTEETVSSATNDQGASVDAQPAPSVERQEKHSTPTTIDTVSELGAPPPKANPFLKPAPIALLAAVAVGTVGVFLWQSGKSEKAPSTAVATAESAPALQSGTNASQQNTTTSIAVLPFDDFSQEGDQEYFAEGISEELLNVLAQIDGLRVTSRTSAFAFKGREASVAEIAQALGVSHILEGSVRKAGTTLRITAQLIDAQSDQHLWSQTYDRALTAENLFAVQDEISKAIVAELQGRIDLPVTNSALQTDSTEAYDAYLRGRSMIIARTVDSITDGIKQLKNAVSFDPDFAPAHSALVDGYVLAYSYTGLSLDDAAMLAAPHAERALELAPNAPESLAAKGRVLSVFDGNDTAAIEYFKRAIDINPNFANAYRYLGLAQSSLLQVENAKNSFDTAQRLDPLAAVIFANLYRTNWDREDLDAMRALGQELTRLNPDSIFARRITGGTLRESGNFTAAHRVFKDNEALFNASKGQLANLYYQIGRRDLAATNGDAYIKALLAFREGDKEAAADIMRNAGSMHKSAIYRWLGDIDAAYALIKQDIARRNLLSDETEIAARGQTFDVFYTEILSTKNDPAAQIYRDRLRKRFDDHTPADYRLRDTFYAGAMWHMLNGNTSKALEWLDALIDAGHVAPEIDFEPLFDPIRESADFQERLEHIEENAVRKRAAIDMQLADPNPDWVMPEN